MFLTYLAISLPLAFSTIWLAVLVLDTILKRKVSFSAYEVSLSVCLALVLARYVFMESDSARTRPHHVVQKLWGHTIADYWTTNPYVQILVRTNGFVDGKFYANQVVSVSNKFW